MNTTGSPDTRESLPGRHPPSHRLTAHRGSAVRRRLARIVDLVRSLRAEGIDIRQIDIGGGLDRVQGRDALRIRTSSPTPFFRSLDGLDCTLVLEPGRALVGNAGILVTRVLYVKRSGGKTFVIVDAAMNDLTRPSSYGAYHAIVPVRERGGP